MGLSGTGMGSLILSGVLLFNGRVDAETMEKNYLQHSSEMAQAIDYTLFCLENENGLNIEFEGRGRISIFNIYKDGAWHSSDGQIDSLAAEIGLGQDNLNKIQDLLYQASCHSIRIIKQEGTYDVATLLFREYIGSGYYYEIHNLDMSESEMESINSSDYTRIVFNPRVCFVYASPAFGELSFPGKQEYLERR